VEDGAHERHGEVGFEVRAMVPREGRDAVAFGDAEIEEGAREPAGPVREIGVAISMERSIRTPRHDLLSRRDRFRVAEDRGERQREIHHQPIHVGGLYAPHRAGTTAIRRSTADRILSSGYQLPN
jgi:hypothetical protein